MVSPNSLQNVVSSLQNAVQSINAITATINGANAQIWAAFVPVVLTDAATVAVNMGTAINFSLTATSGVGSTRALGNPTNAKPGQAGYIIWTQDATGGRAITFGDQYKAAGGVSALSPTTSANAVNLFLYNVLPGPKIALRLIANLEH